MGKTTLRTVASQPDMGGLVWNHTLAFEVHDSEADVKIAVAFHKHNFRTYALLLHSTHEYHTSVLLQNTRCHARIASPTLCVQAPQRPRSRLVHRSPRRVDTTRRGSRVVSLALESSFVVCVIELLQWL